MAPQAYPHIDALKAILVGQDYLTEADSDSAAKNATDSRAYIDNLLSQEVLSLELLGQAIAEAYKVPYFDLIAQPATAQMISLLPEPLAREFRLIAVSQDNGHTTIASDRPGEVDMSRVKAVLPKSLITLAYALPDYIDRSFELYAKPLGTRFAEIIKNNERVAPEIVDEIIKDAITFRASDIHFEPRHDDVVVRFRVDGVLREAGHIPKEYYDNVLNRVKVESGMRIDEHRAAQDGALSRRTDTYTADLRISLAPTVEGEKIVMRVLSSYVQSFALSDLGFDESYRDHLMQSIHKPFGMILTVGPTGSGKTSTLYALLKLINNDNVNVTTIEDPVEYKMPGVNQIQVSTQSDMSFARGLRTIVRQDPDIILVGEIRDRETAEVAVNAALTGHLLLSSFHANDAATAIPRLIDMGVEPFLLASTLELIISQRLVRKICTNCRYSVPASEVISETINPKLLTRYFNPKDSLYRSKGCAACNQSGYIGRVGLFELIQMTSGIKTLIMNSASAQEIQGQHTRDGGTTMFADGIMKAKSGLTSLEEVLRVIAIPEVRI